MMRPIAAIVLTIIGSTSFPDGIPILKARADLIRCWNNSSYASCWHRACALEQLQHARRCSVPRPRVSLRAATRVHYYERVDVSELRGKIRDIKNFPTEGILFKDITTLLKDGPAF